MRLPAAPVKYDALDQANLRKAVNEADMVNVKYGKDIELARGERLILRSPNGSRFAITVDNSGTLGSAAL